MDENSVFLGSILIKENASLFDAPLFAIVSIGRDECIDGIRNALRQVIGSLYTRVGLRYTVNFLYLRRQQHKEVAVKFNDISC